MYSARTQEDILTELQDNSETAASKIEGTFENDMLASNSIEFAKMEVELEQAYKAAFAESSWGEYLTMIAAEFGVDRKTASKATGTVTVTGTGTISEGSMFATASGINFVATEEVEANGSAQVKIESVATGSKVNVEAGKITYTPLNIPGITAVTNAEATDGGYDEESDEELLERYFVAVRTPATSGNKWHYYNWAMSVNGVGDCRVLPLWNGPGTVKVIIVDSNRQTASQELMDSVYEYIESARPIGATATVATPEILSITVTAAIKGTLDAETCKNDINARLAKKALSLTDLSYAQVIDIILNQSSVEDCDNVLLNGEKRLSFDLDTLPVVEEVVASVIPT